jgi:hypothetical protein
VVLISTRYSSTYRVVFRNSGVAVSTVLLRLALSAPHYVNALLGLGAALFALALTVAYNRLAPQPQLAPAPQPSVEPALQDQRASQPSPAAVAASGLYSQPTQPR